MSYELFISRGEQYSDNFLPITIEEWNGEISNNENLVKVESVEVQNPQTNEIIKIPLTNAAKFIFYRKRFFKKTQHSLLLSFKDNGVISSKYTNSDDLLVLKDLAKIFSAEVFGEEGVEY